MSSSGKSHSRRLLILSLIFALESAAWVSGDSRALAAAGATREFRVFLPLVVEGQRLQDAEAMIEAPEGAPGRLMRVRPEPMLSKLEEWVDAGVLATLRQKIVKEASGSWLYARDLSAAGLTLQYDERALEIRIQVPALIRRRSFVSITGRRSELTEARPDALEPSEVSGFINAFGAQDFVFGQMPSASASGGGGVQARQPFRADFDGALNVHSFVLEGSSRLAERNTTGVADGAGNGPTTPPQTSYLNRGDVRLVKDWESQAIRFSAGDVAYPVTGFQRFRALGGVSAVTNFNIQPYRVVTPIGSHEIFLRTNSIVRVFLNGKLLQTLSLPAGRHDLRDFPFQIGSNDVTLEITDDVGRVETVRLPYVYSDQLLAQGLHQVAYAIGAPTGNEDPTQPSRRTYQGSNTTYSFSHRLGVTDQLTLGAYTQGDDLQTIAGVLATTATSFGTLSFEPVFGKVYASPNAGVGWRVGYIYSDYLGPSSTQRNFTLGVESRSPRLALLGDRLAREPYAAGAVARTAYDYSANYGQLLFRQTSLNLGGSYQRNRLGDEATHDSFAANLVLSRSWMEGLDTSLTLTRRMAPLGQSDSIAFFLLTWAFPEKRQYVWAAGSTDGYGRVQWNYNSSSNTVGSTNLMAGAETGQAGKRIDAQLDYAGNRGRATVYHEVLPGPKPGNVEGGPTQRSSLRASSAVAFAGGSFAIGRPVTDSFALVKTEGALSSIDVQVNPRERDGELDIEAESGLYGPAMRPELVSYRYDLMQVIVPESQAGPGLPQENFLLKPTYKSGTLVAISSDSSVFVQGTLSNASGNPVGLWSGELHSLSDPSWNELHAASPVVVFTSRSGRFSIEGLRPGRYEVRSLEPGGARFRFELVEQPLGVAKVEIEVKLEK